MWIYELLFVFITAMTTAQDGCKVKPRVKPLYNKSMET